MKRVEPPLCTPVVSTVFIGKNRRGNWVAREQNGIFGGLFVNRTEALKYALFENGHHPETIIEPSHEIELDISASSPQTCECDSDTRRRTESITGSSWIALSHRNCGGQ
ncbi:hypothetical protein [Bradyrhizobium valentinum]|uniref:hypothetical protein n=1 Tax=Bradyrhizobium valentinum TaxID=1518501 RepID=UPI0007C7E1FE|nr:hypothetical protein [Bradyrhizobium valentinum]